MSLNIYYSAINNKYGVIIEDKVNKDLIYAKIGLSKDSEMTFFNAIESASNFLTKMNTRGLIKKEDDINIIFNGMENSLLKYIEKPSLNLNKITNKDKISAIKIIRNNMSSILKKTKVSYTKDNDEEITSIIKKAIIHNDLEGITGFYNKDLNKITSSFKSMIIKKDDNIELNTLAKLNEKEKSKIKKEIKSKQRAEIKEIRQSPEYIEQMTNILTNEMVKGINTSQLSIQEEYDLAKIKNIVIYTDGSMKKQDNNNNNKAYNHGYGVVILDKDTEKPLFKFKGRFSKESELMGHIELVELYAIYRAGLFINKKINSGLLNKDISVTIMTDNQDNIHNYDKIKNEDFSMKGVMLFKEILKETKNMDFKIEWVKGHSNNLHNREADKLAKSALEMEKSEEYLTHQTIIEEKDELFDITKHIKSNEIHFRRKMG